MKSELTDLVERLYEEHYDSLFRYLVLSGSTAADADEFVQEGFLRLFETLRGGSRVEKPRNWLIRVLHNLRIDESRRALRRAEISEELRRAGDSAHSPATDPETALLQQEWSTGFDRAVRELTERQRDYLLLRAEGWKLREIAEIYGVAVQAVADSIGRAMSRLGKLRHE